MLLLVAITTFGDFMKTKTVSCPTRVDVAKLAGVSVTIVSYVLNNNRYVEKSKREKVLKAVKELNYKPNSIARAMKGKSSDHIAFIVDNISNGNFSEMVAKLDEYTYKQGSLISLLNNRNTDEFIRQIIARRFDGVIISSISFLEERIKQLVDNNISVVLLKNRNYSNIENVGIIDTGLNQGASKAVEYLYDKGCKNIIYVDRISRTNNFSTTDDFRLSGYINTMKKLNLEYKNNIITGCHSFEETKEKIISHIQNNSVDAILTRNYNMAFIAMQSVLKMGLKVPNDISIIGFDSPEISQYISPAITTIEVQKDIVANSAIKMLKEMSSNNSIPKPQFVETILVERESTLKVC